MGGGVSVEENTRRNLVRDHLESKKKSRLNSSPSSGLETGSPPKYNDRPSPSSQQSPQNMSPSARRSHIRDKRGVSPGGATITREFSFQGKDDDFGPAEGKLNDLVTERDTAALAVQASAHWHRLLTHAREQRQLESLAQSPQGSKQVRWNEEKKIYERVETFLAGDKYDFSDEVIGDSDDNYQQYAHTTTNTTSSKSEEGRDTSLRGALVEILQLNDDPASRISPSSSSQHQRRRRDGMEPPARRFFPRQDSGGTGDLQLLAVGSASSEQGHDGGSHSSSRGSSARNLSGKTGMGRDTAGHKDEKEGDLGDGEKSDNPLLLLDGPHSQFGIAGDLSVLPPLEICLGSRTSNSLTVTWDSSPLVRDVLAALRYTLNGEVLPNDVPRVTYELQVRAHQTLRDEAGEVIPPRWDLAFPRTDVRHGTVHRLLCNTQYVLRGRRLGLGRAADGGKGWGPTCVIRTGPGPPSAPREVVPSEVSSSSIMLSWTPPERDNGLPVLEYLVRLKDWRDGTFRDAYRGKERLFLATNLTPNTVHVAEVYAVNRAGVGACSERTAVRTLKPGAPDMTPWVEHIDVNTNKLFYVHARSKTSASKLPAGSLLDKEESFRAKRMYLRQRLARQAEEECTRMGLVATTVQLEVPRSDMLLPSLRALRRCRHEELRAGPVRVKWQGEAGLDAGGLSKDWFCTLARRITDGGAGLLQPSDHGTSVDLRADAIHGFEHVWLFRVIGSFFAKAIVDDQPLGVPFSRLLLQHFMGREPTMEDLALADPSMHRGLEWVRNNDVDGADLTFSASYELFGETVEVDLGASGPTRKSDPGAPGSAPVTNENKDLYLERMLEWLGRGRLEPSLKYLLEGFHAIVPAEMLQHFKAEELQMLLGGRPSIELDEIRVAAQFMGGYTADSPQVRWLWEWMAEADQELLGRLLAFVTGCSTVPVGGLQPPFTVTMSLEGAQEAAAAESPSSPRGGSEAIRGVAGVLPRAHTCFNQLVLPPYASAEVLSDNLRIALDHGAEGFFLT